MKFRAPDINFENSTAMIDEILDGQGISAVVDRIQLHVVAADGHRVRIHVPARLSRVESNRLGACKKESQTQDSALCWILRNFTMYVMKAGVVPLAEIFER